MTQKLKQSVSTRRVQVGYETYMNTETGELVEMPKFVIEGGDINFEKVWVWHLCEAYKLIGNKAVTVLNYLFQNRDQNNLIMGSQRKIASDLGISPTTVASIIAKLKSHNVISMPQSGLYRINPEMMWKGSHRARMQILYEYRQEKANEEPPTREEKLQALNNKAELLMQEVAKIQVEMNSLREVEDISSDHETEAAAE